jgi:hypothetical protein
LSFRSGIVDIADQQSPTRRVEHETMADLISRRVILPSLFQATPAGVPGSSPPVIKPIPALRMEPLGVLDQGSGNDVHEYSLIELLYGKHSHIT